MLLSKVKVKSGQFMNTVRTENFTISCNFKNASLSLDSVELNYKTTPPQMEEKTGHLLNFHHFIPIFLWQLNDSLYIEQDLYREICGFYAWKMTGA